MRKLWCVPVLAVSLVLLQGGPAHATFPGQNGKIAFQAGYEPNSDIVVMNSDGTGQADVSQVSHRHGAGPRWSPDGSKLSYAEPFQDCCLTYHSIETMNADGSGFTGVAGPTLESGAAWSPDGNKLAFCDYALYIVNADGSGGQTEVVPWHGTAPRIDCAGVRAWSPDGKEIAFRL